MAAVVAQRFDFTPLALRLQPLFLRCALEGVAKQLQAIRIVVHLAMLSARVVARGPPRPRSELTDQVGADIAILGDATCKSSRHRRIFEVGLGKVFGIATSDAFVTRLREEPGFSSREVPAIALTANARVEDRIEALAAGFQMHVPKPVGSAELIAVVAAPGARTRRV